jgi:hypothetical protein
MIIITLGSFSTPYPGIAETECTGATSQEQEGAESWETVIYIYCVCIHQEKAGMINKSNLKMQESM